MSAFARAVGDEARPPARTTEITPDEFSDTWRGRPTEAIVVGVRVPSERDYRDATTEANKVEDVETANRRLFDTIVARGLCDPNDVTQPHPFFQGIAEDVVPVAFKARTAKRLFDEIERLAVEQSPVYTEATEQEIADLWSLLVQDDPFAGMTAVEASRCRRYLKFALEHFHAARHETEEAAE